MWYTELKEIRLAIGMQAKELAEKVGKSATYISRIESGAIINTSFELVSSIARVIAESEEIKSSKVDLNKYNSDFAKLVLSYRYESMKDIYDYVNKNKEVEQYSNIIRYLNKGDIDLFETVARYRVAEGNFNDAKKGLEQVILMNSGKNSINEAAKMYNKEGYRLVFPMKAKIEVEEIIKGDYSSFLDVLTNEINYLTEHMKGFGIGNLLEMKCHSEVSEGDEYKGEIILQEPVMEE
ncbi:MAG: helix-turn-helix domain-containing protein [Clostridium saudiense]|uniref:helix-turn-helix domain-containing protein n=1 Tax=Clostridium saudiense TaxID=1414720 RepID=UPI00290BC1F1|nr:helix-turn-helix domain-containing protein [Clostridium saudiense]MDU3520904.1 helix-turn-helix domain-containing protein [Clostridium saudiense]